MSSSEFQGAVPITEQSPNPAKALSLEPQVTRRSRMMAGAHPPQLPALPFAPHQASTEPGEPRQLSATVSTQADIKCAAVPVPLTNSKHSRRSRPEHNPSLPTLPLPQPRKMARYYASALTPEDKTALAEGRENHNLKSWTAKDMVLREEFLKNLKPTDAYIGPDKQLSHQLHKSLVSSATAVPQARTESVAGGGAEVLVATRTTSYGSYFANNHRPVSCQQPFPSASQARVPSPLANEVGRYKPRKEIPFDHILPHRSGKGETIRDEQGGRWEKVKKATGMFSGGSK